MLASVIVPFFCSHTIYLTFPGEAVERSCSFRGLRREYAVGSERTEGEGKALSVGCRRG